MHEQQLSTEFCLAVFKSKHAITFFAVIGLRFTRSHHLRHYIPNRDRKKFCCGACIIPGCAGCGCAGIWGCTCIPGRARTAPDIGACAGIPFCRGICGRIAVPCGMTCGAAGGAAMPARWASMFCIGIM